jgi:Helix-turn-helix family
VAIVSQLGTRDATATRRLAMALEPVAGQVYFAPECHAAYADLGFSPSPGTIAGGVELPDGPAYFTSRGSVMGQVPGEVVAAAFAVFNPEAVVPAVAFGWSKVDAPTICAARTAGAVAQLVRILGSEPDGLRRATELLRTAVAPLRPEGKPLFAGLLGLGLPGDPMGDMWRLADMLREFRGDAHTAAWTTAAFDAAEIGLLTELYWGIPLRTYVRTRAWSDDQLDAAESRLEARGLLADGVLTPSGRAAREAVEAATDAQCAVVLHALGRDVEELVGLLSPWGSTIRAAGGYPAQGPHDLAPAR